MNTISNVSAPKLSGVVQFDDTYFRENQKGNQEELVSPFPKDFAYERVPRYGKVASMLGVRGNEFVTVSCAIDTTGHAVCKVLGCGIIKPEVTYDFITEDIPPEIGRLQRCGQYLQGSVQDDECPALC